MREEPDLAWLAAGQVGCVLVDWARRFQDHGKLSGRPQEAMIELLMKLVIAIVILAALLSGCQQRAPEFQVEQVRSYTLSKEAVWNQILAFLRTNDIAVLKSDLAGGVIQAGRTRYQDAGWAYCEPAVVTDRSSNNRRPRRTRIWLDRDLALEIQLRDQGGMVQVALDARFSERQVDPHRNLPFQVPCRSTGVLEKALLDAI